MLDDPQFYPVLNRGDWKGGEVSYSRPWYDADVDGHCLVVSYAVIQPETNVFLSAQMVQSGEIDPEEAHEVALRNLVTRDDRPQWEVQEIAGSDCLVRAGDELAVNDLLDPALLAEACEQFDGPRVYLAIPNRFVMFVGEDSEALSKVAAGMFHDAVNEGEAPLSPVVYQIANGKIVADLDVVELAEDEPNAEDAPGEATGEVNGELVLFPWSLFFLIARIDGEITGRESKAYLKALNHAVDTASPAVSQLFLMSRDFADQLMGLFQKTDPLELAMKTSQRLVEIMPPEVLNEYTEILLKMAESVAAATVVPQRRGLLFWKRRPEGKMSETVEQALQIVCGLLLAGRNAEPE
ncbi:MAG: hypothetical protein AAF517_07400 [Planctomycetota bacterium]